jgi:integrase/recombinase XerD
MHKEPITKFHKLLEIKRYAPNTIRAYVGTLSVFSAYFSKRDIPTLSEDDIQRYVEHKIKDKRISFSAQKGIVGAITLFYKHMFNKKININYLYPDRPEYKLPKALSIEDVKK